MLLINSNLLSFLRYKNYISYKFYKDYMKKALAPRSFSEVGFTLLEMLVVIGIIAILVSLGFASYSTVQKKARDAKRKGDLSTMQKVLEQCYSISSFTYPAISGGGTTSISTNCTALGGPNIAITDPTTKTYTVTGGGGATYTISVTLEDATVFTISDQQ